MTKLATMSEQVPSKTPGASATGQERRAQLRAGLPQPLPGGVTTEEVEAHFSGMPEHYWEQASESDLLWALATVHGFLQLMATPNVPATKPYMEWRSIPETGRTRVMLCTWDRRGLLAKVAATFSALGMSISEAEAFTRSDNLVLDVFSVVDAETGGLAPESRLKETQFLLEGALSEPPRFASVWMCSRHKYLLPPGQPPPRVTFDNRSSDASTKMFIEAPDRQGLLYDILQTLAENGLDVTEAHIRTEDGVARDVVHIRDAEGHKVIAAQRLAQLRAKLNAALTMKPE